VDRRGLARKEGQEGTGEERVRRGHARKEGHVRTRVLDIPAE